MNPPKIVSVTAVGDHKLIVAFDNSEVKEYDVSPLLEKDAFAPLKSASLFRSARVDQGGYAVVWNDTIDLSENELWVNGTPVKS